MTFDAGALIAMERGDPRVRALTRLAAEMGVLILIPAPVLAEVWRGGVGRQARLARFLNSGLDKGYLQVPALDLATAREVGVILGHAPMSVTDGTVCRSALLHRGPVVTSDPSDIQKVIPRELIWVV